MNAKTLVRGLRINADFENEFDMAMMNKKAIPGTGAGLLNGNRRVSVCELELAQGDS